MRTLVVSFWVLGGTAIVLAALALVASGLRIIPEDQAGLVIKRLGATLPPGRLIALDGEAGFQAVIRRQGGVRATLELVERYLAAEESGERHGER